MPLSEIGYFDPRTPATEVQGNLPHWRQESVTYFVTFRLADSIPESTMALWKRQKEDWLTRHPGPQSKVQNEEYFDLFVRRFHRWLDLGEGSCVLANPLFRVIVSSALLHFDGKRYQLHSWVVMPNHVHILVTPMATHSLSHILHTWKSFTSQQIQKLRGSHGCFWQKESFDHIIRSPESFENVASYIRSNPAGLSANTFTLGDSPPS